MEAPRTRDTSGRYRRFWRGVAAGFIAGAAVIGVVALARSGHDSRKTTSASAPRPTLLTTPVKVEPPRNTAGCTDTWTGSSRSQNWVDPRNWSAHRLPGPADRACLGPGTVITLIAHRAQLASLHDEGTLYLMPGANLVLGDIARTSDIAGLALVGGKLGGAATVSVRRLDWQENGQMVGPGTTVLPRNSRATFTAPGSSGVLGAGRRLRIRGDFALVSGALYVDPSAKFQNLKGGHVSIDNVSETGFPQGVFDRRTRKPATMIYKGRLVKLGSGRRQPGAYSPSG